MSPLFPHSIPFSLALDEVLNCWDLAYGIEGEEKVWDKRLAKFEGQTLNPVRPCWENASHRLPWQRHLRVLHDSIVSADRAAFNLVGRALLQVVFSCRDPRVYPIARYQESFSAIGAFVQIYQGSKTHPREARLIADYVATREAYLGSANARLSSCAIEVTTSLCKVMEALGYQRRGRGRVSPYPDLCLSQALSVTTVSTRPAFPFTVEHGNNLLSPCPPLLSSAPSTVIALSECPWSSIWRVV